MSSKYPDGFNHLRSKKDMPKEAMAECINQLQEDIASEQISPIEYVDPYTGSKNTKA
jgi:hypothetical protein